MNVFDEVELRKMTETMYLKGGMLNALDCLQVMHESQIVIIKKLKEILEKENGSEKTVSD